jgi:uncharacterized damage-inducible protein DinB
MDKKDFVKSWKAVRGKTYEFLETVPSNRISWRPHKDLGTFGMQIRHIGVSERAYIKGIRSGKIDFNDKTYDKKIEKDKNKAIDFLKKQDKELIQLLKSSSFNKKIEFHDGVYGVSTATVETILYWLIEHETYHQGVFTCYGRLAGLGKFRLM